MTGTSEEALEVTPVSAGVLASLEHERREIVRRKNLCTVGCVEVDEQVLLGGLERGVVVGLSSQMAGSEADFGILVGPVALSFLSHLVERVMEMGRQ